MQRYTILYIDDQQTNLLLFEEVFQKDYNIIIATSGFEGLKIIEKEPIDLVISDQAMPGMTGVEFFEQLLKINPEPNRILLTAYNDLNALAEAVNRAKIFRYVKKPWNRDDLKVIIDDAINDYQLRKENSELTNKLKNQAVRLQQTIKVKNEVLAELEESKNELEQSEKYLKDIIELSPIPIAISERNGQIIGVNHQFTKVFGYFLEDINTVDNWYLKAYPDAALRKKQILLWDNRLAIALETNEPIEPIETVVCCKDGTEKIIQLHASAIANNIVVMFNDLTKIRRLEEDLVYRKKMEEEILKAKLLAEAANKAKSEFIANMSHEIRTPMNAILGYTEVLSHEISDFTQVEYLKSIQTSGKTLLSLINDILDFSKIEAGKIDLKIEPTSIKSIITEISDIFKFKIKERKIEFITEIDSELPPLLYLDELRIKQILLNLVGNALKFTHQGYVKIKIYFINRKNTFIDLVIEVKDSGIGIDLDQQKRIFEVFEQIEGESDRKYEGTGLGLAISKKLIHLFNGDIIVSSEKGKGSKFIATLKQIEIVTEKQINKEQPINLYSQEHFKRAKILIADDDPYNLQIININLRKMNFQVIEAKNGKEALEKINKNKPDLVLLDLLMPYLDGLEVFKLMQKNTVLKKIPVIAMTSYNLTNEKQTVLDLGFSGYLTKPIDYNALRKLLKQFLGVSPTSILPKNEYFEISVTKKMLNDSKLNESIDNLVIPLLKKLEKIKPKKVIIELGETLQQLGIKLDIEQLNKLGNELIIASNSFNVEKEKILLYEINKWIDNLKK